MADPGVRRARVYDTVRSAHLERLEQQAPGTLLARRRRYDFDPSLLAGLDLREGGTTAMVRDLWRLDPDVLEVNEPLMRPGITRAAVAVLVAAVRGRLSGRRTRVVTYAIENRDPFGPATRPTGWRGRVRWVGERLLSRAVARRVDRIAFGTQAAAQLYGRVLGRRLDGAEHRLVPAVSSACSCDPLPPEPDRVLYLGALSHRKGIDRLVDAWPLLLDDHPTARLTVLGKGDLEGEVRQAAERHEFELVVDPPRSEVHRALRRASVLVLLSRPTATWREQVGLPLVEGLAHGCTVVTTDQTGLAGWLAGHGHEVVAVDAPADAVAAAVGRALDAGRSAADVLADLPDRDGRLAADDWLHG